ncbi:MAG: hypothetical protein LBL71_02715 [Endomicrobium sp.]|jgi:hypothetical protein|nr:hypothetical protein [Endomicrobium sp.]
MTTERLVKWSKNAQEFFETAEDNSIVLDLVISFGCASQTGEGFEELVNTINSPDIKRKIKKVNITDTSYLYRHTIGQFSGYCDVNIPTEWFLRNKSAVGKITVPTELKSWVTGLQNLGFRDWYKQIREDFIKDVDFRNIVIDMANTALLKSCEDGEIGKNIDFILEETAYTCLNFKNVNMVYPMDIAGPVQKAIEKYNLNVCHLSYSISDHAGRHKALVLDRNKTNDEIVNL